ncbi:MAG: co-chaperone GroES [Chloroflexi bacterium]|nr:co-chaperone GroES [Chloroflexota bacterium]
MGRTFAPLSDRVLVKPVEREEQTRSGIFLPDTAQEKPQEGRVVAVGPGRRNDEGNRIELDVQVDDIVLYAKYGGTEIKEEGEEYLLLAERDILAKVS